MKFLPRKRTFSVSYIDTDGKGYCGYVVARSKLLVRYKFWTEIGRRVKIEVNDVEQPIDDAPYWEI